MAKPGELKSVQKKIIEYCDKIEWNFIKREDAEILRKFDTSKQRKADQAKNSSLFFEKVLREKISEFNKNIDNVEDVIKKILSLDKSLDGNKEMLSYLRGEKTYYSSKDNRHLNLKLIDFENIDKNDFHITEEYYCNLLDDANEGDRQDIVFLINGIPIAVIECKNPTLSNAINTSIKQIKRYHTEIPQLLLLEQICCATDGIDFVYGPTWRVNKRNLSYWKNGIKGDLESKIKEFFVREHILSLIKDYIVFDIKNDDINKCILKEHQVAAVELIVERCIDKKKNRGLIWHTQGSGKTYTILKAAQKLYKLKQNEKPTILLVMDRNELQDQFMRNVNSLGFENIEKATSIKDLQRLLRNDYRGIIVTMIHKFRGMEAVINERSSIYILVDEAHRSTQGELGNYLVSALPNSTMIGFTGTPTLSKKTGRGTFNIFGCYDENGYTHKYSIEDSIRDGTTLPLYYKLASESGIVTPKEIINNEFFKLLENEDIDDIEDIQTILDQAIGLKAFLKSEDRVDAVAKLVSKHFTENVKPLGFKAFLVGVDREACVMYKNALDRYLDQETTKVIISEYYNDPRELKEHYLKESEEKALRKEFIKKNTKPEIFIVTEKLLTGYDAPILYCMYLDKPMKNHTLLQAISRINRPYDNEGIHKLQGLVYDLVGIFDEIEKAITLDSENSTNVINNIEELKDKFLNILRRDKDKYIKLISNNFDDKDIDTIIDFFKDKNKRNEFKKYYKSLNILYEYLSPDNFFSQYLNDYETLTAIYKIIDKAFSKQLFIDEDVITKTQQLISKNINIDMIEEKLDGLNLNVDGINEIKKRSKANKVSNIDLISFINNIKVRESKINDKFDKTLLYKNIISIQEKFESNKENINDIINEINVALTMNEERINKYTDLGLSEFEYEIYIRIKHISDKNDEEIVSEVKQFMKENELWNTSEKYFREFNLNIMKLFFKLVNEENKDIVSSSIKELKNDYEYLLNK
ncbi:HsdR family type I site-specific deoxyribonuclease [Clostridioides difficile]|nr:HsdR family type I site-specific deoxyribonuclease [Clostridioides difficile]HBG0818210.1 type I restriction endonuclease subunit R [Clostridioides difficile]